MTDSDLLISVDELASRLDDPGLRILDCRASLSDAAAGLSAWADGHIPGARHAHLEIVLSSPVKPGVTGRHPLPLTHDLDRHISRWSISADTEVVVYDASGGPFAARCWWLLRWAGVRRVRLLDGGFPAWKSASHPVTTVVTTRPPATAFTGSYPADWVISSAALAAALADPDLQLLDARALPRYRGEVEPIDPVAGHIPGACCEPWEGLITPNGHGLPLDTLQARLAAYASRRSTVYCGSGVTACQLLFSLVRAGHPWPVLYAGSWSEWITDPVRPVATGQP
jgi:thiosulfate/3-mercaptopyruvate sulfurtransferase